MKNSTDAMKDSRVLDYVNMVKLPSSFIYLFPHRQIANFENYASNMFKMIILAASFTRIVQISSIQYRKLDFEEFCATTISVHQLEGMETWEQQARHAYDLFEKDGNRPIMIEELAPVSLPSLSLHLS